MGRGIPDRRLRIEPRVDGRPVPGRVGRVHSADHRPDGLGVRGGGTGARERAGRGAWRHRTASGRCGVKGERVATVAKRGGHPRPAGGEQTRSSRLPARGTRSSAVSAWAAAFADLHFIGVGTPQQPGERSYDLSRLFSAVRRLAPCLKSPAVVAVKSTIPVGTAPRVRDLLHEFAPAGDRIEVARNRRRRCT
ncbi:hypothetical protein ACFWMG_33580 [Streptomyces sp. NPDC127074]|uniref:hypothetical protein n=1 Tax=Streptomyces sp. NPDC127074 TaxID=3347130 RepID=UPI0036564F7D